MRLLSILTFLVVALEAQAQQPPAASNLTPTEMNALVNTLAETEMKSKTQPPSNPPPNSPQPAANPVQSPAAEPMPMAAPTTAPMPQQSPTSAAQNQPLVQPQPPVPNNTNNTSNASGQAGRNKSPFMIPTELYNRVKQISQTPAKGPSEGLIDNQVEVRRRWPLRDYNLVAVMWDVKNPKAMISDREGKLHIFRVKDYIANSEGYIAEITNGEVIVVERGAEIKLKLKAH